MDQEVSDSLFNMWRAVVSLAAADGQVEVSELDFLRESVAPLPLNDEQRSTLEKDFEQPGDVNTFFGKITEPSDRSHFIYFARLLFWSDGDFDEQERHIFELLREQTLDKADLTSALKEAGRIAQEVRTRHENIGFRERIGEWMSQIMGSHI